MLPLQAGTRRLADTTEACQVLLPRSAKLWPSGRPRLSWFLTRSHAAIILTGGFRPAACPMFVTVYRTDLGLTESHPRLPCELRLVKYLLPAACNTLVFAANGPQRLHALSCALYLLKLYHLNRTLGAGKDFAAACQMPDQTSTCAAQHSMCPRPSLELSPLILSNMQVYITVGASSK